MPEDSCVPWEMKINAFIDDNVGKESVSDSQRPFPSPIDLHLSKRTTVITFYDA